MKALLFSLALLLSLSACKKDDLDADGLVPATQDGKDTADFLLNGEPWGPKSSPTSPGNPVGARWEKIQHGSQILLILGRYRSQTDDATVNIKIPYIKKAGTFILTDEVNPFAVSRDDANYMVYVVRHPSPTRYFTSGVQAVGRVDVTRFDTIARVISGRFEGKLRDYRSTDSLSITKGRFDLKF